MSEDLERAERFRFHRLPPRERMRIPRRLRDALEARREILAAVVYGSFAEGRPFRDIDLAIYAPSVSEPLRYKFQLEGELERLTGHRVDIILLNAAPPWLARRALARGMPLLERAPLLFLRLYLKALDEEALTRPRTA